MINDPQTAAVASRSGHAPAANAQFPILLLRWPAKDGETGKYVRHTFALQRLFLIQHAYYQ
jgi:hypothetical protein